MLLPPSPSRSQYRLQAVASAPHPPHHQLNAASSPALGCIAYPRPIRRQPPLMFHQFPPLQQKPQQFPARHIHSRACAKSRPRPKPPHHLLLQLPPRRRHRRFTHQPQHLMPVNIFNCIHKSQYAQNPNPQASLRSATRLTRRQHNLIQATEP